MLTSILFVDKVDGVKLQEQQGAKVAQVSVARESVRRHGRSSWLYAVLVVLGLLALSFVLLGAPVYETGSDITMTMIASGSGYVDAPNEHLLFSSVVLGFLFNKLYLLNRSFAWYGIHAMVAQVVALAVISRFLSRGRSAAVGVILACLFLLAFGLRASHLQEYTTTALLVSMAGSLAAISAIDREVIDRGWLLCMAMAVALFGWSSLICSTGALLSVCLTGLVVAVRLVFRFSWQRVICAGLMLSSALVVVSAVPALDIAYYNGSAWKDYYAVHGRLGRLFEQQRCNSLDPRRIAAWKAVSCSPADVRMFRLDPETFSLKKAMKASSLLPVFDPAFRLGKLLQKASVISRDLTVLPAIVLLLVLPFLVDRQLLPRRAALLMIALAACVLALLTIFFKLPARVYSGVLAFPVLAFLYYSSSRSVDRYLNPASRPAWIVLAALCMIVGPAVWSYRMLADRGRSRSLALEAGLEQVKRQHPGALFVIWADALPCRWIRPFDNVREYLGNMKLLRIGTLDRSPIAARRMSEFGIKDLVGEMDHPDVFHFSRLGLNDTISQYMVEHHRRRPKFELVYEKPDIDLQLYKATKSADIERKDTDQSASCPLLRSRDMILYPSADFAWKAVNLRKTGFAKGISTFSNTGRVPVLSLVSPLDLAVESNLTFAVEIAVDPWIVENRRVCVQMRLNGGKRQERFFIPLLPDGRMHRYVFELSRLKLSQKDRITQINVLPLYARPNFVGERFQLRRFGFIKGHPHGGVRRSSPEPGPQ